MRRNLVTRPKVESLDGYGSTQTSATLNDLSASPLWASQGVQSIHYKTTATASGATSSLFTFALIGVDPGRIYAASVDLNLLARPASPATVRLQLQWFTAGSAQIGPTGQSPDLAAGLYVGGARPLVTAAAPPTAAYARIAILSNNAVAGEVTEMYADGFMLEPLFIPSVGMFDAATWPLHDSFASMGALPTGATFDNYGTEPGHVMTVAGGKLTIPATHADNGAGYSSVDLGAKVTKIKGRWVFGPSTAPPWVRVPPAADTSPTSSEEFGMIDLGATSPKVSLANIAGGGLFNAHIHVSFNRTYYQASVLIGGPSGSNQIIYLVVGVFPGHFDASLLMPNDGTTVQEAGVLVADSYLLLMLPQPDSNGNRFIFVSHPLIASSQASWAMWEVATFVTGDTVCGFTERFADTAPVAMRVPGGYFDGDSAGSRWDGPANASASRRGGAVPILKSARGAQTNTAEYLNLIAANAP